MILDCGRPLQGSLDIISSLEITLREQMVGMYDVKEVVANAMTQLLNSILQNGLTQTKTTP